MIDGSNTFRNGNGDSIDSVPIPKLGRRSCP